MSISRLIRWGGLAGAAGGALWVVLLLLQPSVGAYRPWEVRERGDNVVILAAPLIHLGIVALYGHQRRRSGTFGRFAFAAGCAGAALMLVTRVLVDFADVPEGWFGASSGLFFAGLLLFGLSVLFAGEVPAPAAALLLVSSIVLPLARLEAGLACVAAPFGMAWVWLGWVVWRGRRPLRPRVNPLTRPVSFVIGTLRPADHTN